MIILPAIGAIVAAVAPLVEAALVAAGIGAVVGGAVCGISGAASNIHEHGSLNRERAISTAHGAAECAVEGAVVSAIIAPAGIVIAPAIAPALQIVDDVAQPAIQVIDDLAKPVFQVVDDAVGPTLRRARHTVTAPVRAISAKLNARNYRSLPDNVCSGGCLYIMDDAAHGANKIGVTNSPARRLAEVQRDVNSQLNYVAITPVDDVYQVEAALHRHFTSKNIIHPNHTTGTEWFSGLSPMDVATVLSR